MKLVGFAGFTAAVLVVAACGRRDDAPMPGARPPDRPVTPDEPTRPTSTVEPRAAARACDAPGGTTCVGDDVVECRADRTLGHRLQTCDGPCKAGACATTCGARDVELIYVVDDHDTLSRFDPRELPDDPFRPVGKLGCDPTSHPVSMAVDHGGIAWVLYGNGKVYRVSILDARCSAQPVYAGSADAPLKFGMGFVTDGPEATTETLFVAGANGLARLDTAARPPRWVPIGALDAGDGLDPELTGTGDGKLFAYFPGPRGGFVQRLDPRTGHALGKRLALAGDTGAFGAWAFAHWGGVFYVFVTIGGNSAVHAVDAKTGAHRVVAEHLPYQLVGAGVSTCAPLLESPPG